MTCETCASERESRLRAERELNEAALATSQRLITLAESLARAEREGDEARAQMYAATTATAKREEDVAYAQKRIEGLEAFLSAEHSVLPADRHLKRSQQKCHTCHEQWPCTTQQKIVALSSPAVTAEGKKLGEEGWNARALKLLGEALTVADESGENHAVLCSLRTRVRGSAKDRAVDSCWRSDARELIQEAATTQEQPRAAPRPPKTPEGA